MSRRKYGQGQCPVCERWVVVLQDNTMRRHAAQLGQVPPRICDGWGRPAKEVKP